MSPDIVHVTLMGLCAGQTLLAGLLARSLWRALDNNELAIKLLNDAKPIGRAEAVGALTVFAGQLRRDGEVDGYRWVTIAAKHVRREVERG